MFDFQCKTSNIIDKFRDVQYRKRFYTAIITAT